MGFALGRENRDALHIGAVAVGHGRSGTCRLRPSAPAAQESDDANCRCFPLNDCNGETATTKVRFGAATPNARFWSRHDDHFEDGQSHKLTLAASLVLCTKVGNRALISTVAMAAMGRYAKLTKATPMLRSQLCAGGWARMVLTRTLRGP